MSNWSEQELKEINDKAYFKWIDAGRPDNMHQQFWDEAEKEFSENHIIEVNLPAQPSQRRGRLAGTSLGTGYFYCPYVPLQKTPVILDPAEFTPRKGILTRYGKKLLKDGAKYYSRWTGTTQEQNHNTETSWKSVLPAAHLTYATQVTWRC